MGDSIFQTLLNRLTDLSTRNKSLYLPKLHGNGFVDLQDLDFLSGEPSFEILKKVIQGKNKIPLIDESDPRLGQVNQLSKQLSRIAARDQMTQEETGDQSLFLAWPFVEGKMLNGQVLRAPLLLWACQLQKQDGVWRLNLDGLSRWNSAFLLAYSRAYGVKLDAEELNARLEGLSKDPLEFRTNLVSLLEENFSLKLSSDLFEDRISLFPNSQISIDSNRFQDGNLSVKPYAVLGQFAQKGGHLFRDYEELGAGSTANSLEELLVNEYQEDPHEKVSSTRQDQLFTVFPVDAAQEEILLKARRGKSLTVEGPPGSGKSQLISNLVSDFISRGKRVLVVSQKRVALDVVFNRLSAIGMGSFLGLVHDYRADQKALFLKLKSQIEAIENYQKEIRDLDSMQLEREIALLSSTFARHSEKFEELRSALFESGQAGLPIKAMYLKAAVDHPALQDYGDELLALNYESGQSLLRKLKLFYAYHKLFATGFWSSRISFALIRPKHYSQLIELIKELEAHDEGQSKLGNSLMSVKKEILRGKTFSAEVKNLIDSIRSSPNCEFIKTVLSNPEQMQKLIVLRKWINDRLNQVQNLVFSIPDSSEAIARELNEVGKIRSSWLGGFKLKLLSGKFQNLKLWFQQANLAWNSETIRMAEIEFSQISQLQVELANLPAIKGLRLNLSELDVQLEILSETEDKIAKWDAIEEVKNLWNTGKLAFSKTEFLEFLTEVYDQLEYFEQKVPSWKTYLSPTQIEQLLFDKVKISDLNLPQTFSEMTAFDQFLDDLDRKERDLLEGLMSDFPDASTVELIEIFWNSWYLQWISELERRSPVLLEAGSLRLKQEMSELKEAILKKREIAQFMALLRLKEGMCNSLEFNRLGNRLTYRELLHQVSKKRQKWPVRKLVENFSEEIFRLSPCWLASPETVSALFPLGQKFDLVIFDEASQCLVERGISAMLRGKQVVVAGDSKQLRPSDFYQVKWESEEEGLDFEAESLLELAGNYFEKTMLKGHYRSSDPILIQFSNQKFYQNRLEVLSDFNVTREAESPISWEKVEGVWDNQMNKAEVEAVVKRVKVIQSEASDVSIGIVTGNYFQMELIRDKLWEARVLDDKIRVRNIENVQGDEFDQVILSLGYAPNREGKLSTNFGLLGKSGAENRLNVAITRARKRMHIISSIEPSDFRPTQVVNPGLKLLQEFLAYAKSQAVNPVINEIVLADSKFEGDWSLKQKLEMSSEQYNRKVPSPVMDLLKRDASSVCAILTDDERFFSVNSAKAAMAYHPILLESKGWKWEWKWTREEFLRKLEA